MANNKPEVFKSFVLEVGPEIYLCDQLSILGQLETCACITPPSDSVGLHP
jgi:hypothetical protein